MTRIRLDSSHPDGVAWRRPIGPPLRRLQCDPDGASRVHDASGTCDLGDPISAIAWLDNQRRDGYRWVGMLSYDLGSWFEATIPRRTGALPLILFTEHQLVDGLPEALPEPTGSPSSIRLGSDLPRQTYIPTIQKAIRYIAEGDIFQVNIAQQIRVRTNLSPSELYTRIQRTFPAWHAALLEYDDFSLVCNSPELFLRTGRSGENTLIETRPIKGTRPRSPGMDRELQDSVKDQAELNMIVDLERNDLGRICCIGSVQVAQSRTLEEHPTVYHGSATVTGVLREGIGLLEILRATFPGGSITGAPKIRATQIIHELEPSPRGPYCGAIGYLDADGAMELNIAIRTLILHDGVVHIPVGGGIVADSDPEQEYEETLTKASAALRILGIE